MRFKIGFRLMDLDELLSKSTNPDPIYMDNRQHLLRSLYPLSMGEFWFEIDGQKIPAIHPDWKSKYPNAGLSIGIDYQVLQLLRNLEECMPMVLQPIPDVLAQLIRSGTWSPWKAALDRACGGPSRKDIPEPYKGAVYLARSWWTWRELEFWYLVAPLEIYIWSSDEDIIHLHWNTHDKRAENILTMVEANGDVRMERQIFLKSMEEFGNDLLSRLSERIQELNRRELIDAKGYADLEKQFEMWKEQFNDGFSRKIDDTDWPATLVAIKTLEPLVGPLF